jgi:hypothetical protein
VEGGFDNTVMPEFPEIVRRPFLLTKPDNCAEHVNLCGGSLLSRAAPRIVHAGQACSRAFRSFASFVFERQSFGAAGYG